MTNKPVFLSVKFLPNQDLKCKPVKHKKKVITLSALTTERSKNILFYILLKDIIKTFIRVNSAVSKDTAKVIGQN